MLVCVCVCVCVFVLCLVQRCFQTNQTRWNKQNKKSGVENRASRWRGAADGCAGVMPLRPHSRSLKAVCTSSLRPHTLVVDGHTGVMTLRPHSMTLKAS